MASAQGSSLIKVDKSKYEESLLQKAFEYVLRLRVVYYSNKDLEYKKNYFCKYVIRLAKSILLFLGSDYSQLMKLSNEEVVRLLSNKCVIKTQEQKDINDLTYLFNLYQDLNIFLLTLK